MQTRIVTRPAIAAMALVIAWTATPRATIAQQCRRTCETGETRDVRGCCVPAAKPVRPERTPRRERRSREEPKAEAPARPSEPTASKPSEPPASKPSDVATTKPSEPPAAKPVESPSSKSTEGPAASKLEESERVRQQRDHDPAPTRPPSSESSRSVPAVSPWEQAPGTPTPTPAPETPGATQRPRTGLPPGATAPGNLRTEPTTTTRTEPMAPSRPDTDRPADTRPGMLEPPRVELVPDTPVVEQEPGRRWPVWMPWAVVGAGAVMTGVGGLLYTTASSEYEAFDKEFSERCINVGCNDSDVPDLMDQLDRARTMETMSRISMIAGGVTLAAGVALVFLNQPAEPTNERATARTFVVPTLSPGTAGISAGISF